MHPLQSAGRAPDLTAAHHLLRHAGLRPTRPRLRLAWLLFCQGPRHVSAEMLASEVAATGFAVAQGTIYNALNAFARAGLVREVVIDGERTWFDTHVAPHHHMVDAAGHLHDIPADVVSLGNLPPLPAGQEIASVELVVRLRPK
ncbi:MAG: transcriptional repressor [Alphaproteobacteria bacterium]|nr:transcriptional repressor [Alphaproteobacteria bacterium]